MNSDLSSKLSSPLSLILFLNGSKLKTPFAGFKEFFNILSLYNVWTDLGKKSSHIWMRLLKD